MMNSKNITIGTWKLLFMAFGALNLLIAILTPHQEFRLATGIVGLVGILMHLAGVGIFAPCYTNSETYADYEDQIEGDQL